MRRTPHIVGTALGLAAFIGLTGCAPSAEIEPTPESGSPSASQLASALEGIVGEAGIPGGAVLLTDANGAEVSWLFGEASDGAPVSGDTEFAYRSVTKSLVGTVILQLADEGALDLDAPVADYIDGIPKGDEITIAELALMRSGLPNYSANPGLGDLLGSDPGREPQPTELTELAYESPNSFSPGAAYEYSNTNTLLLGEIIESVSGNPWMTEVEDRILQPLSLDSVQYGFDGSGNEASGFQILDDGTTEKLPPVAPGWFGAAGALSGNIGDLAAWGRALGSGALIEDATRQRQLDSFGPTTDDPASPLYDEYGFAIGQIDGWIGHTGNGLGFQSLTMYDPESGRVIAILLNGTGDDPDLPATLFPRVAAL